MKLLQSVAWYPPHSMGGTEVYLVGLVAELNRLGIQSRVCVPAEDGHTTSYRHAGVEVLRYPVNANPRRAELKGLSPHDGFDVFVDILKQQDGAIYHQHSWTRGCGLFHLQAARERKMPTVVTVHVPGNLCLRGTMMRMGHVACQGPLDEKLCAACWLHSRGLSSPQAASWISALPLGVSKACWHLPGRLGNAMAARYLAHLKQQGLRQMIELSDRVVVVSQWLHDALVAAGAPQRKLFLSRHGLDPQWAHLSQEQADERSQVAENTLRLLYLGRWDPIKGIDIVVRAVTRLPKDVDVELVIHAVGTGRSEEEYRHRVQALAEGDSRVKILSPVSRDTLWQRMGDFDALVVPSQCLETGPLVVLEALSRGLFIIGSDLGGVAEWVVPENGLLVPAGDVEAWSEAVLRCHGDKQAGRCLRRTSRPLRSTRDVASEMYDLYEKLV